MPCRPRPEAEEEPQRCDTAQRLRTIERWLHHADGSEQEIAEITTACGEAATNAIEHTGAVGRSPFEVAGRLHGRRVEITVQDHGAWRDPRDGDRGRGLSLMRALMDDVEVDPGPKGTTVRLSLPVRPS